MARTIDYVVADGVTAQFTIPFPYLDKTHVIIYLDGVATDQFSWLDVGNIAFPNPPPAGTIVGRRRVTPTSPLVRFRPGNLSSEDLNVGDLQPLYVSEEARDFGDANLVLIQAIQTALDQEVIDREAGDAALSARLDGFLGVIEDQVAIAVAAAVRAVAAAKSSEVSASAAKELVDAAISGFQGFTDGNGYDFGWVNSEMTYFNRDWGTI